jgi:hypothetical protein
MSQKSYKFSFDRLITLKFLHEFSEAVFIGVAMQSLLGDEVVLLAMHEQRLKRAITFYLIVGSRSKFYMIFGRPCSLRLLWNHNSVMSRFGWPD